MSTYAVIKVGGKQYRVQEGERLLVDRVKTDEGKTFHPTLLMLGGDGKIDFAAKTQVTARVVGHVLAGEHLHAEHLRIRVAAVPRRAESLLVGHQ